MDGQLSLLPDLDRASDERKPNLCNGWNNAILNENGVFIENRVDIEVYKTKKLFYPRITIHLALEYPKVYYSFDVCGANSGGGGYPSRNSNNFDVHEHVNNVALMMEHALRSRANKHGITANMIDDCINKFKDAIASDGKANENGICTRCGFEMLKKDMKNGLCAACYALLNPTKEENEDEWTYLCKDFVKVDSVQDLNIKYEGLMKYASYKGLEKCPECNKKFHFLYDGLCLPCYEKKRKKSEEIARGFISEGWKEVPDKEKESAMHEKNGWVDERNMDAFEPRKGTRFFLIDVKSLTWKCYFKRSAG